jgi:tetratricopeptide (TPR) repeat protein
LLLTGDHEGAFNKLKAAADTQPTDPYIFYELAGQAADLGSFDEADKALQSCKHADEDNPFCSFRTIELRVYQDRFSDAISEYQHAETSGISFPWLHEPAGYAKLAQDDCDGALKQFDALQEAGKRLANNVHFRASQEGIAAIALYQGKLQRARQQTRDALTSKSKYDRASYYISLAEMDALHSQATDAVKEAYEATTLSDAPDILISAVRVFAMTNEFDRASALLAKHEDMSRTVGKEYHAAEHLIAGFRSRSEYQWDAAIAALKESYRLDPRTTTAYYLASLQMSVSRWSDAKMMLDELLASKGQMLMESPASLIPLSQLSLATCYERLGDRAKAVEIRNEVSTLWKDADPELRAPLFH